MTLEKEFVNYIKSNPKMQWLMEEWKQQYYRLNRFGGTIYLNNPTKEEKEAIGLFMGESYVGKEVVAISYVKFLKAVKSSKFEGIDLKKAIEYYFGITLVSRKDQENQKKDDFDCYISSLLSTCKNTYAEDWMKACFEERKYGYHSILQAYKGNYLKMIDHAINAFNQLPFRGNKSCSLAIFSNQITGNPHYFDEGSAIGLLLQGIAYIKQIGVPSSLLEQNQLLYEVGLLKDDISNYCIISHLYALNKENEEHNGLTYFANRYEPLMINVVNINDIEVIKENNKVVFIIENPSVFRYLLNHAKEKRYPYGFVCSNGQINFATYLILDKLAKAKITMYYCGDFDPEGVLIACKLKERYVDLNLWRYSINDYLESHPTEKINDRRIKSLEYYQDGELALLIKEMRLIKKSGYQETIISKYINDMDNMINDKEFLKE